MLSVKHLVVFGVPTHDLHVHGVTWYTDPSNMCDFSFSQLLIKLIDTGSIPCELDHLNMRSPVFLKSFKVHSKSQVLQELLIFGFSEDFVQNWL